MILFTSLIFAVLVIFLVWMVYINARNNAQKQNDLLRGMMKAQEEERERLARDLHDELGVQFLAIKMHVGLLGEPEEAVGSAISIENTQLMIDNAMSDLKLAIHNLIPASFSRFGLIPQLYELKTSLNKTHHIKVNIDIDNQDMRFNHEFEINLYRMLQEMISNTLKYAHAKTIAILLNTTIQGGLKLDYKDDGIGFNMHTVKKGLGIQNIETRARFYNGVVELRSSPLDGTAYIIIFEEKKIGILYDGSKPTIKTQNHRS